MGRAWRIGLAAALLLLPLPTRADARGGQWRGPSGTIPPNRREVTDPAPPPPPPAGRAGGPSDPSLPVPVRPLPPHLPPRMPVDPGVIRSAPDFSAWMFWYHHQRELLEVRPAAALSFARRSAVVSEQVLPALIKFSKVRKRGGSQSSTALIALGRAAQSDAHIDLLLEPLADARGDRLAMEGAAIGLGLLRRSEPARQFSAAQLDRVRDRLYSAIKDDQLPGRIRALAVTSIGLLGDQPSGGAAMASATTARLQKLLGVHTRYVDLDIALIHAIARQPLGSVPPSMRSELAAMIKTNQIRGGAARFGVAAHALLALGRIGQPADLTTLAAVLTAAPRARGGGVRRSAVIALGTLATRHGGATRDRVAAVLLAALPREQDLTTSKLIPLTLARMAAQTIRQEGKVGPFAGDVDGFLRSLLRLKAGTREALPVTASYACLGLGLMARALRDVTNDAASAWRLRCATALRAVLADVSQDLRHRSAAAMALGLLALPADRARLLSLLSDTSTHTDLRSATARALGLLGSPDAPTRRLFEQVFVESSPSMVRLHGCGALAMFGEASARDLLLRELRGPGSGANRGAAALALGNLGSAETVSALLEVVADRGVDAYTRAAAIAALGRIGDPEAVPSLAHVVANRNWRLSSDLSSFLSDLL